MFIKAAIADMNPDTLRIHRQEIAICQSLPLGMPTATYLGSYDDGHWVALLFDDIQGRHPAVPWIPEELSRVAMDLADLHERLTPNPIAFAQSVLEKHRDHFMGFRKLRTQDSAMPSPWIEQHLDELAALEEGWETAARGTTLVHGDVRADNILLTGEGEMKAWFVDWPGACVAAPWLDIVGMAPSVVLEGG